jgi:Cu(I)/Ag(I) efflux system membrane protein CusA/SilA
MTGPGSDHLSRFLRFFIERPVVVVVVAFIAVVAGVIASPFESDLGLPRDPVPVDALPDLGENQQIVFTEWPGRSPQDVEDQIGYPLSSALMGISGVKTVRSSSMFGFSSIYLIFEEGTEFYWARSRVLEKLASLPMETLPDDVQPTLGPDATGLGQVFWYTLEGHSPDGEPVGGWDLGELRTIQDWQVRQALLSVPGVSEIASVGGFVQEYQIEVDPDALRAHGLTLEQVYAAVRGANLDVGAQTIEINRVEYVVRGVGFLRNVDDIERTVIRLHGERPVTVGQIAHVSVGPAPRRGLLDKAGTEAVGGVVVVRHGANPMAAISAVKEKIAQISPGLPRRQLEDGTISQVTLVPFYDRSGLIQETIGTLDHALRGEILVTIVVVLAMVMHLRSSLLIAGLLPLSVLMCFVAMRRFGVEANIVALSGIAIAIGTLVDMGVVVCENIFRSLRERAPGEDTITVVVSATREVAGAVLTAVTTTVVSFLPVFTMIGAEGKLFRPLAFTKTFALIAALFVALLLIPALARVLFTARRLELPPRVGSWLNRLVLGAAVVTLARFWAPLGETGGLFVNLVFVALLVGGVLAVFVWYRRSYRGLLEWSLQNKGAFLSLPVGVMLLGMLAWLGVGPLTSRLPDPLRESRLVRGAEATFPGLGQEFMPPLDEGSFLFMPTTMPHASIGAAHEILRQQDLAIGSLPEVESVVGKIGRVESALDPAPVSMVETIINYFPEYRRDARGRLPRYRFDDDAVEELRDFEGELVLAPDGRSYRTRGSFLRDEAGHPIESRRGRPWRNWRVALDPGINPGRAAWPGVRNPEDIWDEISRVARVPGSTGAPRLQPIAARQVMLQSGMRAPMGIKVQGPDLESLESFGLRLEELLRELPMVRREAVFADRVVGKPWLEIHPDRDALARYGIPFSRVQQVIETAIGGRVATRTVEGRERYGIRVRYPRELRDDPESIRAILVPAGVGGQVPLGQIATIRITRGPQMIRSENTFLTSYVIFDAQPGLAEVEVIESVRESLDHHIEQGSLVIPAGVSFEFEGTFKDQQRARKTLSVIVPLALVVIFLVLYLQFSSVLTTAMVFSGVFLAWSGGFMLLWLMAQPGFLDFPVFGVSLAEIFHIQPYHLSVAVWVGFLALFGIATDDGVIMATYLDQSFRERRPRTREEVRQATLSAAARRIRPCLMTTATTVLALLPVLSSQGRGADVMVPMALPSIGGMLVVMLTTILVPVLYAAREERGLV